MGDELDYDGQPKSSLEIFQEAALAADQPLLDVGWRLDYERKGITRAGQFISLADLKVADEALINSALVEKQSDGEKTYRERLPRDCFLPREDVGNAVHAFEAREEIEREKAGRKRKD